MLNCISCMLWIKFLFHKYHCIWQGFNFNGNIACHLSLSWIMLWVLHLKTHHCSQGHNFQEFYNFASHIYIHDLLQISICKICVQIDLFLFFACACTGISGPLVANIISPSYCFCSTVTDHFWTFYLLFRWLIVQFRVLMTIAL